MNSLLLIENFVLFYENVFNFDCLYDLYFTWCFKNVPLNRTIKCSSLRCCYYECLATMYWMVSQNYSLLGNWMKIVGRILKIFCKEFLIHSFSILPKIFIKFQISMSITFFYTAKSGTIYWYLCFLDVVYLKFFRKYAFLNLWEFLLCLTVNL